jgi:hypothetical protein
LGLANSFYPRPLRSRLLSSLLRLLLRASHGFQLSPLLRVLLRAAHGLLLGPLLRF